jgi:hypothetical protein
MDGKEQVERNSAQDHFVGPRTLDLLDEQCEG